jgi:hypothetical protein
MNIILLAFIMLPLSLFAQDSTKTEKAFKIVPLITSSPLLGFGYGAAVSYLYLTDEGSSKSQLSLGGQHSVTNSYVLFADNKLFWKENSIRSNTFTSFSSINNEFISDGVDVSYNVQTLALAENLLFEVVKYSYFGGILSYKQFIYDPNNIGGEDFLQDNGIVDEKTGGLGVIYSFDSRANKYYPSDAWLINVTLNTNPSWLGAVNSYYQLISNFRYYATGFHNGDVWAWQLYGQYSSEKTTDNGLPTLSGKSLLRGFPAGQYKARYMTGAQTEYRYQISNTRFRLISFIGIANLAGGSYGDEGRSREDDGWYSAGGLGARYTIQPKTGVDLRLDFVYTSKNDKAIYLKLNQSF